MLFFLDVYYELDCSDVIQAAEKSLQDLKSLPSTSEQQLAAGEMHLPQPYHAR